MKNSVIIFLVNLIWWVVSQNNQVCDLCLIEINNGAFSYERQGNIISFEIQCSLGFAMHFGNFVSRYSMSECNCDSGSWTVNPHHCHEIVCSNFNIPNTIKLVNLMEYNTVEIVHPLKGYQFVTDQNKFIDPIILRCDEDENWIGEYSLSDISTERRDCKLIEDHELNDPHDTKYCYKDGYTYKKLYMYNQFEIQYNSLQFIENGESAYFKYDGTFVPSKCMTGYELITSTNPQKCEILRCDSLINDNFNSYKADDNIIGTVAIVECTSESSIEGTNLTRGQVVCMENEIIISYTDFRYTILKKTKWDGHTCKEIICNHTEFPKIENGNLVIDSVTKFGKIICSEGFTLYNGKKEIQVQCLGTGWELLLDDYSCYQLICSYPTTIFNSRYVNIVRLTVGYKLEYECMPNYVFYVNDVLVELPLKKFYISCGENLKWSSHEASCQFKKCPVIKAIPNSSLNRDISEYFGTTVTINCNQNHEIAPKVNFVIITCGEDGQWNHDNVNGIECKSEKKCLQPEKIADTTLSTTNTTLNGIAEYKCKTDFHFNKKVFSLKKKCNETYDWEPLEIEKYDKIPKCKPIYCPIIKTWLNIKVNTTDRSVNTVVNITCRRGYRFKNFKEDYFINTCTKDSDWKLFNVRSCVQIIINEANMIRLDYKKNPCLTVLKVKIHSSISKKPSLKTVQRVLYRFGLYGRIASRKPFLKKFHRTNRFKRCKFKNLNLTSKNQSTRKMKQIINFTIFIGVLCSYCHPRKVNIVDIKETLISNKHHPKNLHVEFDVDGQKTRLNLKRNNIFKNEFIPIMIDGYNFNDPLRVNRNLNHYIDTESQAVFNVESVPHHKGFKRYFTGTFIKDNKVIHVKPQQHGNHFIREIKDKKLFPDDYDVFLDIYNNLNKTILPEQRFQERNIYSDVKTFYVEIIFLLDDSIWSWLSSKTGTSENELDVKIREIFGHIMNGISMSFASINSQQYNIEIKPFLNSIVIHKTVEESYYVHGDSVIEPGIIPQYTILDGIKVLNKLGDWSVNFNDKRNWNSPDHVMLWTTYNIVDYGVIGYSYVAGICKPKYSISICEYSGIHSWKNGAHELGHNLGADHDGIDKACPSSDQYIMSPTKVPHIDYDDYLNTYTFSSCSVQKIYDTLMGNVDNYPRVCVFDKLCSHETNEKVDILPGEQFTRDEQCTHLMENTAKFCEEETKDICYKMYCKMSGYAFCRAKAGATLEGTKCGYNMWCREGECIQKYTVQINDDCENISIPKNVPTSCEDSEGYNCGVYVNEQPESCFVRSDISYYCCRTCHLNGLYEPTKAEYDSINPNTPEPTTTTIKPLEDNNFMCMDLYTYCEYWKGRGYCTYDLTKTMMEEICPRTCGVC
ncbi:Snake venom metalloproteinase neuwiedase [Intoshia linei]|uniref:Snake venom metalloproteinase neuwiedase n=1 Tax=Intoshia linei TaxID=1819745 RepID=A0A177BAL3_9BILA|nr:Snake venom metalloproteinase neuwiedase [Intoshia linei]